MAIEVAAAKRVVFNLVEKSVHDADGHVDLVLLEGKMAEFSDADLRLTILMKGNSTGDVWPLAISLASGELDRRASEATAGIARQTTVISAVIGAIAAISGAVVGAWLSN